MTIIDYSTSRPSVPVLQAAGITAVGRYIGWDCEPGFGCIGKNLSVNEARILLEASISIFLAFEYDANAAARGATQGSKDGRLAQAQLTALGAPSNMGVYFAVDFDIPDYAPGLPDTPENAVAKLGPVAGYFQAVNNLRNPYQVGGYGGYWAVKRLFDAGLITLGWQTVAWSGGNLDNRAALYQVLHAPPIIGADVDIREHENTIPDFGQWSQSVSPPQPQAPSFPYPDGHYLGKPDPSPYCHSGYYGGVDQTNVLMWQTHMVSRGWSLMMDGLFGPNSETVARQFQSEKGLVVDGKVGVQTWKTTWTAPIT